MKIIVYTQDEFEPAYSLGGVTHIKYNSKNEKFLFWNKKTGNNTYAELNLEERSFKVHELFDGKAEITDNVHPVTICEIRSFCEPFEVKVLTYSSLNLDISIVTHHFDAESMLIDSQLKRAWFDSLDSQRPIPFFLDTMEWVENVDNLLPDTDIVFGCSCIEFDKQYLSPFYALQMSEKPLEEEQE